MSLSKWKELADKNAKTGNTKKRLHDEITAEITEKMKNDIRKSSDKNRKEINDYNHYKYKTKTIRGYGLKRGRGV